MDLVLLIAFTGGAFMLIDSGLTGRTFTEIIRGQPAAASGSSGGSGGGYGGTYSGPSTGSQKQVAAGLMSYFESQGLTRAGAAGIVGNWMQESGLNPNEEGGYLAQWLGGRLSNLQNFASSSNQSVTSAGTQAEFAMHELQSYPGLLQLLKTTNDPSAAALAVSSQYERPGTPDNSNRVSYAQAAYNGTL